ncbi:MAG: Elongation factor Ts [Candidatus Curtissbacteria bacterium GW2011_GWA1_40_24]|uniref:Elongation factor Ts n=1 Tax=Candidatus Curtissbacteria bacterium GW2011_GWA1_40_24 TaxID=1618406 RepID=A0A0G0UVP1_9BACT|nr:MAG: Elongation factor Ts [Candidatus Curtissbacteria bacterium GW2011_GWA1_40_24]
MKISIGEVKKLRGKTGAGIADCRKALEESGGDFKKAEELLKSRGAEIASKKADRATGQGMVETYIHVGGKVGTMVEVNCETDFVAKTEEFKNIDDLVKEVIAKVGENIKISRFIRFELGGE